MYNFKTDYSVKVVELRREGGPVKAQEKDKRCSGI